MHVKDYRIHQFAGLISTYIDDCHAFASEFHLDDFKAESQTDIGIMPEGKMISSMLTERQFHKLSGILKKAFGLNLIEFNRVYPLFIINILSEYVMVNSESIPLDTFLWQMAKSKNRKMLGLETIEDQYRIMNHISLPYQVKALKSIGANVSRFKSHIGKLISAYEEQKVKSLYLMSKKSLADQKTLLLYNRNQVMADTMMEEMKRHDSVFSAIGVAHLWGNSGVLALLKRAGCRVSPVKLRTSNVES